MRTVLNALQACVWAFEVIIVDISTVTVSLGLLCDNRTQGKWVALYLLQGKEGMKQYEEDLREDE
jgi:hypothetical protein